MQTEYCPSLLRLRTIAVIMQPATFSDRLRARAFTVHYGQLWDPVRKIQHYTFRNRSYFPLNVFTRGPSNKIPYYYRAVVPLVTVFFFFFRFFRVQRTASRLYTYVTRTIIVATRVLRVLVPICDRFVSRTTKSSATASIG
jgi:hypothetical protein